MLNAEADTQSTDWVQFVFHRVCDKSTGGHCGAYSISPRKLSAFLDFSRGEVTAGRVVVETTAQVIGGPLNPACHWDTGGTGCMPPAPQDSYGSRTGRASSYWAHGQPAVGTPPRPC